MPVPSSAFRFEVLARDPHSAARLGRLYTPHGVVETPVFMPVGTAGTVKAMTQQMLEELDAQLLLANTYHLLLRPGPETIQALGGLHRFMAWPRALLTDSGGYQVFSMNTIRKVSEEGVTFRSHLDGSKQFLSPEKAIEVQAALGADLIMVLDECLAYPASREKARQSMELTLRWAKRCQSAFTELTSGVKTPLAGRSTTAGLSALGGCASGAKPRPTKAVRRAAKESLAGRGFRPAIPHSKVSRASAPEGSTPYRQALFGIVQGGTYAELRRECARRLAELDFAGYAIGGLAVGEPPGLSYEMTEATLAELPAEKPRYLMGVGYPRDLIEFVRRGVDLMDCVLPTRNARNGYLFTWGGTLHIRNAAYAGDPRPIDARCGCAVCRRYTRAYLRHLFNAGEILAATLATHHNLYFYLDLMRRVRAALRAGTLNQLAAELEQAERAEPG